MVEVKLIPIDKVRPNPLQPRENFDKEKIKELADSIKETGLLQPLVVRKKGESYQIIAGERRWRALSHLKRGEIPAIVWDIKDDVDALEKSVIENLQREDLIPTERENVIAQLWDSGKYKTKEEMANKLGLHETRISAILKAREDRREFSLGPTISSDTIIRTAGLSEKIRKKLLKKAEKENIGERTIRKHVDIIKKFPESIRNDIVDLEPEVAEEVIRVEEHQIQQEVLKKAKKLSPEGVRDYAQKLKSESEEMHVKEGIVYTVGEYDCTQCKKHCVIKCNGKTHWIE